MISLSDLLKLSNINLQNPVSVRLKFAPFDLLFFSLDASFFLSSSLPTFDSQYSVN